MGRRRPTAGDPMDDPEISSLITAGQEVRIVYTLFHRYMPELHVITSLVNQFDSIISSR